MHATQLFIDQSGVTHVHVECAPCMGHDIMLGAWYDIVAWYCVYRVALLCDKFWACLDLKKSSNGWKCKKVSTVPHLPLLTSYFRFSSHCFGFWILFTKEAFDILYSAGRSYQSFKAPHFVSDILHSSQKILNLFVQSSTLYSTLHFPSYSILFDAKLQRKKWFTAFWVGIQRA